MDIHDKLRERSQPLLEPGEQIQSVFMAMTGPSPWLQTLLIYGLFAKYKVVVITDRNIVLLKASFMGTSQPTAVLARLPREPLAKPEGRAWGKVTIGGERHWVHRRFFNDVAAADGPSPAAVAHAS